MGYLCVTELWDECRTGEAAYLSGMLSTDVFAIRFLHYESFIIYVVLRAVIFAVGEAVIGYLARRNVAKAQGQTPRLIATLVIHAILIIGSAMLLWSFTYTSLERFFGLRRTLFNVSSWPVSLVARACALARRHLALMSHRSRRSTPACKSRPM